jgi:N-acetylneuraminic acid mutarotase
MDRIRPFKTKTKKSISWLLVGIFISSLVGGLLLTRSPKPAQAASTILYRVNAGGPQVSATPAWTADTKAAPSTYGNAAATGNLTQSTTASISAGPKLPLGTPLSLFKSLRTDTTTTAAPMSWKFPVTPGEYEVHLFFAETVSSNFYAGARKFNVLVEGNLVEDRLDVFAAAGGGNKGIVRKYPLTVQDNDITIEFGQSVRYPIVNAIEIVKTDWPGTWTMQYPAPTNRDEVSYTQLNGKFYLTGGVQNKVTVADNFEFDPASNAWRPLTPLPVPLNHIQAVPFGGKIYYIGGLKVWPSPHVDTVYIFDPVTNTFALGAPMPRGRGAGGVAIYNNKIYYAGGLNNGVAVPWFDEYDPLTNTWAQLPDMPTAKDHFHAAVLGDRFYAIAGRNLAADALINENVAYDFITGTWVTGLKPAPTPRAGFASAVVGNEILVMGGERRTPNIAFNSVEAYNPSTNSWRVLAPIPLTMHGIEAASCQNGVYLAGGARSIGDKDPVNTANAFFLDDKPSTCLPVPSL